MFDTTDLSSYYPEYDDYCGRKEYCKEYDNSDELHDEYMLRKDQEEMKRKIIDLANTYMSEEELMNLNDYVWKNDKLIPVELIEGE